MQSEQTVSQTKTQSSTKKEKKSSKVQEQQAVIEQNTVVQTPVVEVAPTPAPVVQEQNVNNGLFTLFLYNNLKINYKAQEPQAVIEQNTVLQTPVVEVAPTPAPVVQEQNVKNGLFTLFLYNKLKIFKKN
jgi:hypothetical protein